MFWETEACCIAWIVLKLTILLPQSLSSGISRITTHGSVDSIENFYEAEVGWGGDKARGVAREVEVAGKAEKSAFWGLRYRHLSLATGRICKF